MHPLILLLVLLPICGRASEYKGLTDAWSNITLLSSTAPWTHFVYMIADNNLDKYGANVLEQMRKNTALVDDLNLVVYIDRCTGCEMRPKPMIEIKNIYNCDTMKPMPGKFNGSKILQKSGYKWCEIYDFGHELDSKLPQNIGNFTGLMKQFELTSTYFMLELWDHGGAWLGFGSDENTGGSNVGGLIKPYQLFNAIGSGLQMTHLGRLDILGFDACIMADYSELHYMAQYDIAKYYIASEDSELAPGWDYEYGINATYLNPIDYAKSIINSYVIHSVSKTRDLNSAGYTLGLFDMDLVAKFLNEFDTLVRMMTSLIKNYDYGIIMAILRAKSTTIDVNLNYRIIDLGSFLEALVAEKNIFFSSCVDRLRISAEEAWQSLSESIVYFDADFLRKNSMTGYTIFYSLNKYISTYYYPNYAQSNNNDLFAKNYQEFLSVLNNALFRMSYSSTQYLTADFCSAPIPRDFSFHISNETSIQQSTDVRLYKISTNVTPTVKNATTYLQYPFPVTVENSTYTLPLQIAELKTDIVDEDFDTTSLVTYWDGNVTYFVDNNDVSNVMFATADITYTYDSISSSSMPKGYIVKYSVIIDYSYDGYIQFEVIFDDNEKNIITDMKLFKISLDKTGTIKTISEISSATDAYIQGTMTVLYHEVPETHVVGGLFWPYFTRKTTFYAPEIAIITTIAFDVFGSRDDAMIFIVNNVSYENISNTLPSTTSQPITTRTTTPSATAINILTTMLSDTTSTSLSKVTSTKSAKNVSQVIPEVIWLIIVIVLVVAVIVLSVLLFRKRASKKIPSKISISDHDVHIEMGDQPLHTETHEIA